MGDNSFYFTKINFIPEFSNFNQGSIIYDKENNTLEVGITKSVGTTTGVIQGPTLQSQVMIITFTFILNVMALLLKAVTIRCFME